MLSFRITAQVIDSEKEALETKGRTSMYRPPEATRTGSVPGTKDHYDFER